MKQKKENTWSLLIDNFDYSIDEAYLVTLYAAAGEEYFGSVVRDMVHSTKAGRTAENVWKSFSLEGVTTDIMTLLPARLSGIMFIYNLSPEDRSDDDALLPGLKQELTIESAVAAYKREVSRALSETEKMPVTVWRATQEILRIKNDGDFAAARTKIRDMVHLLSLTG